MWQNRRRIRSLLTWNNQLKIISLTRSGVLVSALLVSSAVLPGDYDPESMNVSAASLLPPETLQGVHYSIANDVLVSGYMNFYTVDSDYGQFTAVGNRNLKKLLHEISAIAELKKMTSADAGTTAVVGVVTDTGKSLGTLVTNPVGTVQNIGDGVSRFFKRTAKTSKDVGQQISQNDTGAGSEADTGAEPGETAGDQQPGLSTSVANAFLGISKAHRELAAKLTVDPYSDNPVLQEELNRVAQISGTVGRITKIFMPIPSIVSTASSVSKMVWGLSPTDLLIQNQETLEALGYEEQLIEQFFANRYFSPTEQTMLVAAVQSLDRVKGREILLQNASKTASAIEGEFMVWSAIFAESYHEHISPVKEFVTSATGFVPIAITESGNGVVFAPLDRLLWTEGVEKALTEMAMLMDQHGADKQHALWVDGEFSPLALRNLTSNDWVPTSRAFEKLKEQSGEISKE